MTQGRSQDAILWENEMREPASQKPGVSNTPKYGQQVFKEIYLVSWRGQE